jgi:hypothetical protein
MSSWLHIRCLDLRDSRLYLQSTITFRGLFAALRLCPHLCTLWLSMDAVNIDIDLEAESFQHPEVVARIIFSMLPLCRLRWPLRQ